MRKRDFKKRGGVPLSREKPRIALGYARCSSPGQLKRGHGLASQEARIREHAAYRGYELEAMFTDNITGGSSSRSGMDDLIAHLRKHKREGRVVVIDDLSRFAKGVFNHIELRRLMSEANGWLESPMMEFKDDPDSVMIELMLATVHQHQREKNAEQTKNRMRGRLLNGYWPFIGCMGWRFVHKPGEGKLLVRDEPIASIIKEGMEGFASGRFQTQAEVKRFLETQPAFPKNKKGLVRNELVHQILTKPLYAGMVEGPPGWDVSLRPGQHKGLISFETFERIQQRLTTGARAPVRADIRADFPLRGAVVCACCGHPLTACWSTSHRGVKHPYYMCFLKGCARYRKSIRRDRIEEEFVELLDQMKPTKVLFETMHAMFRKAWDQRVAYAKALADSAKRELVDVEHDIERVLDRLLKSTSDAVITAYERQVHTLERRKLVLVEKQGKRDQRQGTFEELFEPAFMFLANPGKLWRSGRMEYQKLVLRLTFADNLAYCANSGFRTAKTTLPFRMLEGNSTMRSGVAERKGFEPSRRF